MNLRHTAEVAALVSVYGINLIRSDSAIPDQSLQDYWHSCKQRLKAWMQCLDAYRSGKPAIDESKLWDGIEPVLEEIFVSEILTRVWGATLTACDQNQNIVHAEPIARNTLVGHLEARHLALSLLANGPHVSMHDLSVVDRLRRRTERWTDLLLGHLVQDFDVGDFAFEERRARDFANDQLRAGESGMLHPACSFLLTSLRLAFPQTHTEVTEREITQQKVTQAVMAYFPVGSFQLHGPFRSIPNARLGRTTGTSYLDDQNRPWLRPSEVSDDGTNGIWFSRS